MQMRIIALSCIALVSRVVHIAAYRLTYSRWIHVVLGVD
jgi:hypothetical protein